MSITLNANVVAVSRKRARAKLYKRPSIGQAAANLISAIKRVVIWFAP